MSRPSRIWHPAPPSATKFVDQRDRELQSQGEKGQVPAQPRKEAVDLHGDVHGVGPAGIRAQKNPPRAGPGCPTHGAGNFHFLRPKRPKCNTRQVVAVNSIEGIVLFDDDLFGVIDMLMDANGAFYTSEVPDPLAVIVKDPDHGFHTVDMRDF